MENLPFSVMPSSLARVPGCLKILHKSYKGAILSPFWQCISIMAWSADNLLLQNNNIYKA